MKSNRIDSSFHNEKANSYIEFESLTSNANESDLDAFKEEYTYNNASQNSLINNSQLVILSAKNHLKFYYLIILITIIIKLTNWCLKKKKKRVGK